MALFSFGQRGVRFGVIIDIGSGSVLVAIVASDPTKEEPVIVWQHRENAPIRNINTITESSKGVATALVAALLDFDTNGRQALEQYQSGATIRHIQCSVAAPWSHTVSKNITYSQEDTFEITDELIGELVRAAEEKTTFELKENELTAKLGVTIANRVTMDIVANGYHIADPIGEKTKKLAITHTTVVIQNDLYDTILDLKQKLFPKAELQLYSYILLLHCVTKSTYKRTENIGLIDVTYEATELGVVRDGILHGVSFLPFGLYSLVREISAVTKKPLGETFKYLHGNEPYKFLETLPKGQQEEIETIFESYIARLQELLQETGDELSVPRNIILHTDATVEPLLLDLLTKTTKRVLHTAPDLSPITKKLVNAQIAAENQLINDTTVLVAARFFHKPEECLLFDTE